MHGPLKKAYQLRTNFKVQRCCKTGLIRLHYYFQWYLIHIQILSVDHCCLISAVIREGIDNLDQFHRYQSEQLDEDSEDYEALLLPHASLFAKKKSITLKMLEDSHQLDPAFRQFRVNLNSFLNNFFQAYNIPLPSSGCIKLAKDDQVWLV